MQGARQRAEALHAKLEAEGAAADFFIGLEGGLDVVIHDRRKRVFLESWAYVSDGEGAWGNPFARTDFAKGIIPACGDCGVCAVL